MAIYYDTNSGLMIKSNVRDPFYDMVALLSWAIPPAVDKVIFSNSVVFASSVYELRRFDRSFHSPVCD
jgi:hypothetical protein